MIKIGKYITSDILITAVKKIIFG